LLEGSNARGKKTQREVVAIRKRAGGPGGAFTKGGVIGKGRE